MLFGILEDPHLGRAKNQSVIVLQLNLGLESHDNDCGSNDHNCNYSGVVDSPLNW